MQSQSQQSKITDPRKKHACPNCVFGTRTCGASGPVDSPFVIVGESPGKSELIKGTPFVGESGNLLRKVLAQTGFGALGIQPYITNAIKCFPGDKKDQRKLVSACQTCNSKLLAEVSAYPRKVILALGAGALWSLTGDYKHKITQVRGNVYPSVFAEKGIVACVHPAFLLRGGGSMPKFKQDIQLCMDLLKGVGRAVQKYIPSTHEVLPDAKHITQIHEHLGSLPPGVVIAADTETSGFWPLHHRILCFGFGWEAHKNYVIPGELIADRKSDTYAALKALLEDPRFRWLWHNGKFDIKFFHQARIRARVDEDTMLLSYTLDETKGQHDLEQVSANAVSAPNWKAMIESYLPQKGASYEHVPSDVLYKYLGFDVSATLQSYQVLRPLVAADPKLEKVYTRVIIPANKILARIEENGLAVDPVQIEKNKVRLSDELNEIKGEIDGITFSQFGKTINVNSPIQLATLLYDDLKLPKIKGSRSTDAAHLDALPNHPVVKLIKHHRKAAKALSTYVLNLTIRKDKKGKVKIGHVQKDGRVHATYLLHGTTTGRLASREPNLQNIPRDKELRAQFIAFKRAFWDAYCRKWEIKDTILMEVDLNQAELRVLAELSGDPGLMAIYTDPNHPGLHHEVSVTLFGEGYGPEDKMKAKTVNFGIVYGRTGGSIADAFDMPKVEGDRWVQGWFDRFPVAAKFINWCRETPQRGELLFTPFGRKRRFGVVNKQNLQEIGNQAANFPPQSIASDITLVSNGRAVEDPRYRGYPVNLVHDSGIHEIIDDPIEIDTQARLIIKYMEEEPKLWGLNKVPFVAEAKIGKAWGKLEKWVPTI